MKTEFVSLPIVRRELLVSSRKRLTFWSRMTAALIGFLAVIFVVGLDPNLMAAGALGAKLFRMLTTAAFCLCLFGGALLTADCLSVEKREGTLGLLFLTDLKGYDVVLGKLAAKSIAALFCLLAIFPMLGVPILLGGVTGGDFWRVVIALLDTLFLSASVGMLSSVFSREARNAIAIAEFALVLLVLAPLALANVLPAPGHFFFALFSPVSLFSAATSGGFRSTSFFYASVFVLHAMGWLCLAIAGVRAQTSWHEQPNVRRWGDQWHEVRRGTASARLALRRLLLPINPMLWLESRDRVLRLALVCVFASLATGCWFINRSPTFHWSDMRYAVCTVLFLHVLLKLLLSFDSSTRIIEARRDGALTVVLSTRVSVEEVLRGEFLAARRLFGWPFLIVLLFDVSWIFGVLQNDRQQGHAENAIITVLCLVAVLIANCCALVWTGLHNSIRAKRPYRGALWSFTEIVLAPVLWFGFILLGGKEHGNMLVGILVFTILNFVNTWLFGIGAYQRFKSDLREILTEVPRPPEKSYEEDYALLK